MCGALSVEKKFHRDKACKCTLMHVWGRKLVKYESDTCDQYPQNSTTLQAVWLSRRAIFCQHQSDLLFCFWGNCINLHLLTTIRKRVQCVCNITCTACAHTKKLVVPAWNLLLKKKHCFRMALVLSYYHYMGDAIYQFSSMLHIIIMNKHHNKHVCNSNEGRKVSFMLKETIYGKSLIFSPVIKSIPFFCPKHRLRYAYCHMIVIYILAQWNHKIIYTMKKCNELWSHVKTRVIIYN